MTTQSVTQISTTRKLLNGTKSFIDWTKGKKTYLMVAVGVGTGLYQYFTGHDVPGYIYFVEGLLGLGAARSALAGQTKDTAVAVASLIDDVLNQVTVTTTTTAPTPAVIPTAPSKVSVGSKVAIPATAGSTVTEVTVGKPSPKGVDEHAITEALNDAQLKH